jgi:hypothetical protein
MKIAEVLSGSNRIGLEADLMMFRRWFSIGLTSATCIVGYRDTSEVGHPATIATPNKGPALASKF